MQAMLLMALKSDMSVGALQRPELGLPIVGLATLPSLAMECVLSTLDAKAALNLALTCKACTAGFAEHRLSIANKVLVELMPTMTCPPVQPADRELAINIIWRGECVVRRVYSLSSVPGALKALWAAVWQVKPSQDQHRHYSDSNQHHLATLLESRTYVCWTCMLESEKFLQIPYLWLQDEFLGAAAATFADNTGCQAEPIYAQIGRPSTCGGLLIACKLLRFDWQTNSHIVDMDDGDWWSREEQLYPSEIQ